MQKKIDDKGVVKRLKEMGKNYSIGEVLEGIDWNESYENWTEEVRYLLFRYDEHLAQESGERLNEGQWNKIWAQDPSKSIEHITPRSSGFEYVHDIGNLTMLPPGVNHAAARNGFILAGLAVELTGLVIVVRMHIAPSDRA